MSKSNRKQSVWTPESANAAVDRQIERSHSYYRATLKAFAHWLSDELGIGATTIDQRVRAAGIFLAAVTPEGSQPVEEMLGRISTEDIERFFVAYGESYNIAPRREMRSAMRRFLQFSALQGWLEPRLVDAVPSLVSRRQSTLPRNLSDEELTILLTSPWRSSCPLRDRAIVELLVTYGVRRQQISALQLADLNWREHTIHFAAHKLGKDVHHELAPRVAQCLAEYLRDERPESDSPYIFLRHLLPHDRLSPHAISGLVKRRAQSCNLPTFRPHVLRHTFATRLLRTGQAMKSIADLLGHRSLSSVGLYAKVDVDRLRDVAVEWPEGAS